MTERIQSYQKQDYAIVQSKYRYIPTSVVWDSMIDGKNTMSTITGIARSLH